MNHQQEDNPALFTGANQGADAAIESQATSPKMVGKIISQSESVKIVQSAGNSER